jgi:hypothetical protein
VLIIPLCVVTGGVIYSFVHDHLPRSIRNGIESIGINADIHTIYPGHEIIHLRGSMVMLGCFFVGLYICRKKIRNSVPDNEPAIPYSSSPAAKGIQPSGRLVPDETAAVLAHGMRKEMRKEQAKEALYK